MIAIGGAIGSGLFLGSASRLRNTDQRRCSSAPRLFGMIAYFPTWNELVLHSTTTVLALGVRSSGTPMISCHPLTNEAIRPRS